MIMMPSFDWKESTKEEIRLVAAGMWELANKPAGRDLEFWLDAEKFIIKSKDDPIATMGENDDIPPWKLVYEITKEFDGYGVSWYLANGIDKEEIWDAHMWDLEGGWRTDDVWFDISQGIVPLKISHEDNWRLWHLT